MSYKTELAEKIKNEKIAIKEHQRTICRLQSEIEEYELKQKCERYEKWKGKLCSFYDDIDCNPKYIALLKHYSHVYGCAFVSQDGRYWTHCVPMTKADCEEYILENAKKCAGNEV